MPKKTFECAEKTGVILITQVKDNQENLRKQIKHGCSVQNSISYHQDTITKEHGRIEQRTYEVFSADPMLKKWKKDWPFIRHIIRVTRYRHVLQKNTSPSKTVHYYVTNGELEVLEYASYIRKHWWIENKVHYVRDVAFQEDSHRKQCNPFIYAVCIDMAINIMKLQNVDNIKSCIYKNSLDFLSLYKQIKELL